MRLWVCPKRTAVPLSSAMSAIPLYSSRSQRAAESSWALQIPFCNGCFHLWGKWLERPLMLPHMVLHPQQQTSLNRLASACDLMAATGRCRQLQQPLILLTVFPAGVSLLRSSPAAAAHNCQPPSKTS
ncbi:hypothetical protein EBH_0001140 [Eimeria brunetti]|uniref:Uncharacterized protein n=1 Tax=Eimeria brunetti TaxID=51314 RepID=U6LKB2_9EIME|nr:hypothetical protein EBH_0001140 [Eimeria brunetti]